ncbi:hypothetical protein [Natrinema ejinorense]|uniref:Uncharacterized protein n=1 Tax=Natrinema ejinorense TaxID=373386 RepID=A0A2A5QR71_9EURY|nr:hypothetical protein [Natrinema ejinorense]PCR89346.1 hypothetical protein CP557_01605 [Natrinema ejinorense]
MSEAATTSDVVDTLLSVHEGDRITLEAEGYEWASPFEVAKIDEEPFEAPNGGVWKARRVTLASTARQGSDREFDVYPAAPAPDVGPGYGRLVSAGLVDEAGSGTSTEDTPTSDIDSESEAETDVLEEDAADDAPADAGDDVQEETGTDLPAGVTEDDIDELTSGGIEMGDLADELGVHRNRARWIVHDLGYYKRVREVWRDRERASVDPRLGGVLVMVLGLVTIGLLAVGVTAP